MALKRHFDAGKKTFSFFEPIGLWMRLIKYDQAPSPSSCSLTPDHDKSLCLLLTLLAFFITQGAPNTLGVFLGCFLLLPYC